MSLLRNKMALLAIGVALLPALLFVGARGSDHADTPEIYDSPGVDLSDVFVFPSPTNANNVVLAMCARPLIPSGQSANFSFDPSVLYQFKIDNTADNVEDLVIQASFSGVGANQDAKIVGPIRPIRTGTITEMVPAQVTTGKINTVFNPAPGITAFAGAREDPFFFDLDRFYAIFPDRKTPITKTPVSNPNQPQLLSWRNPAEAVDFLAGFNVLSIVVEVPKSQLIGTGDGKIRVWCTTSR